MMRTQENATYTCKNRSIMQKNEYDSSSILLQDLKHPLQLKPDNKDTGCSENCKRTELVKNKYKPAWTRCSVGVCLVLSLCCVVYVIFWQDIYTPRLYLEVSNLFIGSLITASGYFFQEWAHLLPETTLRTGAVSHRSYLVIGLILTSIVIVFTIVDSNLLGRVMRSPFSALIIIYSVSSSCFVVGKLLGLYDLTSSMFILFGIIKEVQLAMEDRMGATNFSTNVSEVSFSILSYPLSSYTICKSSNSNVYALFSFLYVTISLRYIYSSKRQRGPHTLLIFSSCAGVMAGYASLAAKLAIRVVYFTTASTSMSDLMHRQHFNGTSASPLFIFLIVSVPVSLMTQLNLLHKGLKMYGTTGFVPLYQAFIILGNLLCGMTPYKELTMYSGEAIFTLLLGFSASIYSVYIPKGDAAYHLNLWSELREPNMETGFTFDDMVWATEISGARDVYVLHDFNECKDTMLSLLRSATTSIHYSTFLCDFKQPLQVDASSTIISLLRSAAVRGVAVHILYNPILDYGTDTLESLEKFLPPGIRLTCSISDLGPSIFTKHLSKNTKYAFHHQKYLCIDGAQIMVTGCDVNSERKGWLEQNVLGYFWHELSVVARCTPEMYAWVRSNHFDIDFQYSRQVRFEKRLHHDEHLHTHTAPFPLVSGGWREENAMVNMILHAKHSIHLENQILISGKKLQQNRVVGAIALRVARAYSENDQQFKVIILTNAAQKDEPSFLARCYCTISTQWSLEQLQESLLSQNVPQDKINTYVFVGHLKSNQVLIKVHSNILIIDGYYALRSSSNLADRSLSSRPTDTELGLLFSGEVVRSLQNRLWNMYLHTKGVDYTLKQVFIIFRSFAKARCAYRQGPKYQVQGHECFVWELTKRPWSPKLTWCLMKGFIHASEGATGGRYKVTYMLKTRSLPCQ